MLARVREVKPEGLVLEFAADDQTRVTGWLSAEEWADPERKEWDEAYEGLEPGTEMDVVVLPAMGGHGMPLLSRRSVTRSVVDESWNHQIKEMRVSDTSRTIIRGKIAGSIPAIVSRDACAKWLSEKQLSQQMKDHSALGRDDVIRGFVRSLAPGQEDIELDTTAYLDLRAQEIADEVNQTIASPPPVSVPWMAKESPELSPDLRQAMSPMILVENDKQFCEFVANVLIRQGIEVQALDSKGAAFQFLDNSTDASLKRFKVALVDPNLLAAGTDLCGLEIITRLQARSGCRTVLMTGETGIQRKLREFPNLLIYGYIDKPFTMDELLDELIDAVALENPLQLQFWIRDKDATSQSVGAKPAQLIRESSQQKVQRLIDELGRSKPSVTIHLFELLPRSWRALSLAQFGRGLKWEPYKGKIGKSVIKDTAENETPTVHNRVKSRASTTTDQDVKGHLWTLEMLEYQSFCGVSTGVDDRRLALVCFHPSPDSFDQAFVSAAELCLERLAREVERSKVDRIRLREAALVTSGMALASLAHELTSDLTLLDAYLVLVEGLVKSGSDALKTLEKFRTKVAEVGEKVKILRGAPGRSDHVSLLYCLRKAVDACRAVVGQTIPNPERILIQDIDDPGSVDWLIAAPAGSLIIVIFNLLLNAAQQIDYASGVRRYGKVWPTVTSHDDPSGTEWVRLRIHDTGPGIHRDDWERVFDPGYSTKPEGSGLGLHICRLLLKSIGGPGAEASVGITSSVIWDGTTFTMTLPVATGRNKPVS